MNKRARETTDDKQHLPQSKKIIFTILMITVPILLLLLLEGGLRLFNYGSNLDLFALDESFAQPEYVLNENFTRRYFFQTGIKTPIPLSQRFSAEKDSTTYRIFCLGASTTQGVPYTPNGAFPAQLHNILINLHTRPKIEVINCGITAITSHSVLDITREILRKYDPNLLVIYTGHNEFYGVLGQASRLSLFNSQALIQTFLKLQRSKLFLLMRDIVIKLFSKRLSEDSIMHHDTMMGIMASDVGIPFNSKLFKRTEIHFRKNLESIIHEARDHQTDIILCTLTANLADLPPFSSLHKTYSSENRTVESYELELEADALYEKGQYLEATSIYQQALKSDTLDAGIHYRLGQCYKAQQMFDQAKHHYQLAKDYDTIRFRAPSSFNRIIKEVAKANGAPFVDIEQAFCEASPEGIIGSELIFEHVHPNLEGYLLIAKSIAGKMAQEKMIRDRWNWRRNHADSTYLKMTNLTLLDHEVVNLLIFRLTSHWPFAVDSTRLYQRIGNDLTERMAKRFIDEGESNLVQMHLELGKTYLDSNKTEQGLAEYKAALAIEPICDIYNRIGPIYTKQAELAYRDSDDFQSALKYYRNGLWYFQQGLQRCPDHLHLNFNLGLLYALRNDQIENALDCFQKVLSLDSLHIKAKQLMAHLYLRQKKYKEAEEFLLQTINTHPDNAGFQSELGYVYFLMQDYPAAETWLEKALELEPSNNLSLFFLRQVRTKMNETKIEEQE